MPIHEFQCPECGARVEKLVRNGDLPEVACSKCGVVMHKLISAPMIQFKGSGWYITDYQNKDKKNTKEEKKTEANSDNASCSTSSGSCPGVCKQSV